MAFFDRFRRNRPSETPPAEPAAPVVPPSPPATPPAPSEAPPASETPPPEVPGPTPGTGEASESTPPAPPPPEAHYDSAELTILRQELDKLIRETQENQSTPEAQRQLIINDLLEQRRRESQRFLPGITERIRGNEVLTHDELAVIAEDLVHNRFESSVANAKVLSLTGQKNVNELLNSRGLTKQDIENSALPDSEKTALREWWDRSAWLHKALGKTGTSAAVSLGLTVLTGGSYAIVAAGLAGSGIANLGFEKFRSSKERHLRKQEVQGIVNDMIASQEAAKKIVELRGNGSESTAAYHQGVVDLVEALQHSSQETLAAQKELKDIKHQAKWFLLGLGSSVVGAAAGVGLYEAVTGGFTAATQAAIEAAKKSHESFTVRNHEVKYVQGAWRWLIKGADVSAAEKTKYAFTAITESGRELAKS
nr:hypothetical protein [Candidatus Berkelbacteria bacterium]